MGRLRIGLLALVALLAVAGGVTLLRTTAVGPDPAPGPSSAAASSVPGVPTCPLHTLPSQVADTIAAIHAGGPFPFPRNDGVVFGNRERHLPERAKGYYHEYTVVTPGAADRSTRRIVTGGTPVTDPPQYFYTGDHYDSFCVITDASPR